MPLIAPKESRTVSTIACSSGDRLSALPRCSGLFSSGINTGPSGKAAQNASKIGSPLIGLLYNQQRYEADFRFNLVRVRENSEQIALLRGEEAERGRLLDRFGAILANWFEIMSRTKKVTFFTVGAAQAAVIFPYVVVSPSYFSGHGQLGILTQTANAFEAVRAALSFFVDFYRDLADWRAVVAR